MSPNADRLYELLPAVYRQRDEELGDPLKSLLQVISEQVDVVEADIDQLYRNWFIETAEDWAVPYIADLIGYRPVAAAGTPGAIDTLQGEARNRILIPRQEVANTIRYRRRKGTLALLEQLAQDVAGWPGRAVEFYKLLGWTQSLNHLRLDRGRTVDVRQGLRLDKLNGPFDTLAHTVDVRKIDSNYDLGRHNLPSVGLYVWRLKAYPISQSPAYCLEDVSPYCYTFSVLGNDTPLYINPVPETDPTDIAGELNVPTTIRRRAFEERMVAPDGTETNPYYGPDKSFAIWAPGWHESTETLPIPLNRIVSANLSDWQYRPRPGCVAVDPELGRIAFPPSQPPRHGVVVNYHYGFSADVGGGEYNRSLTPFVDNPLLRLSDLKDANQFLIQLKQASSPSDYLRWHLSPSTQAQLEVQDVTEPISESLLEGLINDLNEILRTARLHDENLFDLVELPRQLRDLIAQEPSGKRLIQLNRALLEVHFADSLATTDQVYRVKQPFPGSSGTPPSAPLPQNETVSSEDVTFASISAAIAQWRVDRPRQAAIEILDSSVYVEQISLELGDGQTLHIRAANRQRPVLRVLNWYTAMPDALNVTLHPGSHFCLDGIMITGRGMRVRQAEQASSLPKAPAYLTIRHSTLVPGWSLQANCHPHRPAEPSLEISNLHGQATIDRSIVGSIQVNQDEVKTDPVSIQLWDSVLDATGPELEAIGAPGYPFAHASLTIVRSTVFGEIQTHAIELAENSIFEGKITVARSQIGCMRFCAYIKGSRTPKRFRCQPDVAIVTMEQQLKESDPDITSENLAAAKQRECNRVRPRFNSTRYGTPAYCQLAHYCPLEITRGADDESEMGVFHHLYQPQRAANLQARLDEYTPAGMTAAILYAS
ncbi:MAG: hypothetical protein AAGA46_09645 [Cyanobacteria bacterium P01_F01_bin.13]